MTQGALPRDPVNESRMTLMDHLLELRTRLIWVVGALVIGTAVSMLFVSPLLQFILLPLKAGTRNLQSLTELISQVTVLAEGVVEARKVEKLKALVELLTPDVPSANTLVREARMIASARQSVIESTQWLTAEQLSTLAGFSLTNPSAQPNKWKAKRMIFAINIKGTDYFPVYALDPDKNHRPLKILTNILEVFSNKKDGWGAAYWFAGMNGFLDGKRPQDILYSNPEGVLAAAKNEVTGINHG